MIVVFRLNHGNREIWLVKEDIIRTLVLCSRVKSATHNDSPICQREFFTNLSVNIPSASLKGRCDEFGTDVAFAELLYIQRLLPLSSNF